MYESVLSKLGNQLRLFLFDLICYLYTTKFLWLCWFLRWLTGLENNMASTTTNEGHNFPVKDKCSEDHFCRHYRLHI